jgi:hypothetical protein
VVLEQIHTAASCIALFLDDIKGLAKLEAEDVDILNAFRDLCKLYMHSFVRIYS